LNERRFNGKINLVSNNILRSDPI
jgi:hypothetical protein